MSHQLKNLSAESNVEELWPIYKSEHGKSYDNADEDKSRFEIFKETIKRIIEHNAKFAKGEVTFSMGLNKFADMRPEEYRCGGSLKQPQNN